VRPLPLTILISAAALSLAVSSISASEFSSPNLLTDNWGDRDAGRFLTITSAQELAVPAPLAGEQDGSTWTIIDQAPAEDPGYDGLVIADPLVVVPGLGGGLPIEVTGGGNAAPFDGEVLSSSGRRVSPRTRRQQQTPTPTPTSSTVIAPTATATFAPSLIGVVATPTPTNVAPPATKTSVPPTATNTAALVPATATSAPTSTPTPTPTSAPPTATASATATPGISAAALTATAQAAVPANETAVSINTPTPTTPSTRTPTSTPTRTPTPVPPSSTPTTSAPTPTPTPAPGGLLTVDQIIAWRGDHQLQHEIALPAEIAGWSWGQHGTEDTKSLQPTSGTLAPWLLVERDDSQLNTPLNVKVNIRNIRCYYHRPSDGRWVLISSGLPGWMVQTSGPSSAGGYSDISPTVETDGSYSFAVPVGGALHMAAGTWQQLSQADGVVAVVEARLLGAPADVAAARLGMEAGADYRNPNGDMNQGFDTPGYYQSGAGRFGLLTAGWRAFSMLSSSMTDAEIQQDPPPVQ
jgi:hypothetical protein